MSDFWLHCDNCKRTDVGVTWVNGFRYCGKCYQEIFGNTNPFEKELRDKISYLEAKLAENEADKKALICDYESRITKNHELMSWLEHKNEELKQQLAEKEDKIETLKQRIDSIVKIYSDDFVSKDTELKELRYKVKQHHQDKISFAVERLEKVKEYVMKSVEEFSCVYEEDMLEEIDNQIKQLKEMK